MKKKPVHYEYVHVSATLRGDSPNVKVMIGTFFHNDPIIEFFVPRTSCKGYHVPSDIVKSRAEKMGVTFDHYSFSGA